MHIGFLTSEYPGLSKRYGGIATSVKNLATAFVTTGQQVTVFLYGQERDEVIMENSIKIVRIKNRRSKGLSWWLTRKKIEKIINTEVFENNLQMLEAPEWTGITAFMKIDCPVVLKLHGSDAYFCHIEGRKQKYKNFFFEKKALRSADAIISVSRYTADLTAQLFGLKKEIEVIHNGIDTSAFEYADIKEIEPKTLLYFGTLIRKKGVLELPYIFNKVIEKMPDAKLYLIGGDSADIQTASSSTWELMKPHFNEPALKQTRYFGKVQHDDMKEHIKHANVCVFPSFAEAFPISWLEAMASRKAIVGSNKGWAQEAIENGFSGFLINPKEHQKFADKILEVLFNNSLMSLLGMEAHKKVMKEFEMKQTIEKHLKYFEQIIEGKK